MTKENDFDFSIIVCCYNPDIEKLIITLESIISQKNRSYQIIISDDGSAIKYEDTIKKWFNDKLFKDVIFNFLTKNVGTVKNIISSLKQCSGKYIKIISPGDYFIDDYALDIYYKAFLEKNAGLLVSDAKYINEEGKPVLKVSPKNNATKIQKNMIRNVCIYRDYFLGATYCFKKELAKYICKSEDVTKFSEDLPLLYFSLINNENVVYIGKELICYEYGTGISTSASSSRIEKDTDNFFKYIEKNENGYIAKKSVQFYNMSKKSCIKKNLYYIFKFSYIWFKLGCVITKNKRIRKMKIANKN